jgi:pimeloyl-ACP methyl ester carboxylesterase
LLLAGHSRGGILALLTAAGDTDGISAVINFSGGWLGQACERYRKINRQLFRRAAKWTGPSLFLYSDDDPFYPLGESRKSHAAFVAGGGTAAFGSPILPAGSNGHMRVDYADAWGDQVTKFLRSQVTLPD